MRRPRTTIVVVVIIAVVIIGIIGYAVTGYAIATTRVANTDRTLNTVISHQNSLNTTFKNIDAEFNSLSGSTAFNPQKARSVTDQFVAGATNATITVNQDDVALASAAGTLDGQRWLTFFSRSLLDKEQSRIDHARKALADARSIAGGYVLDGQFFQAFLDTTTDLSALAAQTSTSDLAGASSTMATMKTHVDKALRLSTAPGLPPSLHALMTDFETLVADFGNLIAAAQANDYAGINRAAATVQSDADKVSAYNYDKISADIDTYYLPLIDDFNSQMAAATA
jgi:hypothetical protein